MAKRVKKQIPQPLKIILSIFGLTALFGFIFASYLFGFMDLRIECSRNQAGIVTCAGRKTRLFGLYKREFTAENVVGVGYAKTQHLNTGINRSLVSGVALATPTGDVPLSLVVSNFESWRKKAIEQVGDYLESEEAKRIIHIREKNIFGWLAVGVTAFIVLSYARYFPRKSKRQTKAAHYARR